MKSKIITLSIAVFFNIAAKSQIGTQTISDEIPESASVTGISTYDPGYTNSFVFIMGHGLTTFNQKNEIFLIDKKTLVEKNKIEYPKYKDYDNISLGAHYQYSTAVDLKQNLTLFYSSTSNKESAISVVRLNESLTVPDKPEFLFTTDNIYSVDFYLNDKKDLCIFTYTREYKKLKKKSFYYRVYNNKLDLLKSDSIVNTIDNKDKYDVKVFDNGFAIIKTNDLNTSLSITDLKNNKNSNLDLSNGKDNFTVENIKSIANDKIVILNYFYTKLEDKKIKNSFLKIIYNLKTGSSEEKIIFDYIPAGKDEAVKENKYVQQTMITETGICYVLLSQNKLAWINYGFTIAYSNKYELVCIGSNTNKWKKQLPITAGTDDKIGMLFSNGNLFLTYINYEEQDNKIDVNTYVYGNPMPPKSATTKQMYKSDVALLKINSIGNIQQQSFPDIFYKSIMKGNKEFIGVFQGVNGSITSKCKFLRLELNDK